ncbi:hypothetical protein BASA81_010157 [Batrachochytrium salamandrivorans]|nr:hypothetical protein BASA81_010157 [Batrachochytrium salamandrivorans]
MSLQLGGGGEGVTAPMRAVRSTSTMAFAYELRRMSRQPEELSNRLERELIMMDPTHCFKPWKEEEGSSRAWGQLAHQRSELTTSALLQTPPNAIPNAESGIELKLCEPGERLEIIVDPVPNNTASEEGGNRSMFNFLGGDGVKQPTILFGSVGYVIDYLVAPHAGGKQYGECQA